MVVAADSGEESNRQWNEKKRNPGAFHEFRNQHDDGGNRLARPARRYWKPQ
jgi:hypothetical protein